MLHSAYDYSLNTCPWLMRHPEQFEYFPPLARMGMAGAIAAENAIAPQTFAELFLRDAFEPPASLRSNMRFPHWSRFV